MFLYIEVVLGDVVLGGGDINHHIGGMILLDSFSVVNQITSLIGVAGDMRDGYGEFDTELDFH